MRKLAAVGLVVLGGAITFSGTTGLVIPRACMKAIAFTEQSECHGPDEEHMTCTGLELTVKTQCEQVRVNQ